MNLETNSGVEDQKVTKIPKKQIFESPLLRQQVFKLKSNAKNAISHINDIQSLRLKTRAEGLADLNRIVDDLGDAIDTETRLSMKTTIKGSGVFKEIAEKLQKQIDDSIITIEKLESKIQDLYSQWNKLSIQINSMLKEISDLTTGEVNKLIKEDIEKLNSSDPKIRNQFLQRFPTLESWMNEYDKLFKKLLDDSEKGIFNVPENTSDLISKESNLIKENLRKNLNQILEDSGARELYQGIKKPVTDNLFSTNSTSKKNFQSWVRKVLYQGDTKVWKIEDLNLTEEVIEFIKKYDSNFYKNLEDGKYKSLREGDEWDQLNMLDTNNKDGKKYLNDLLLRKKGTTVVTKNELDEFLNKLNEMSDEELKIELEYLKKNKSKFTETSKITTKVGEVTEEYFLNDLLKLTDDLSDKFELVYHPGSIKGNPIDTILGIDVILKDKTTKKLVPIQIKKTATIYIKPSKIVPNQDSFSFWLTTPIRLKEGYGVVIDNKNNFVMFGPQMQYKIVDDKWLKTNLGFNKKNNINYVDINRDGKPDFITNIPF